MKIRIDIEKTVVGGSTTYSYPVDMDQVKILKYADDMSFCIAESGSVLPGTRLATDQDESNLLSDAAKLNERLKELKAYRQKIEFGGLTLPDGTYLHTDAEDQRKIDGAVLGAERNPEVIIDFKTAAGYVQLDAATMIAIGQALFNHVQACHTREKELSAALQEDINTDITTGWPG